MPDRFKVCPTGAATGNNALPEVMRALNKLDCETLELARNIGVIRSYFVRTEQLPLLMRCSGV